MSKRSIVTFCICNTLSAQYMGLHYCLQLPLLVMYKCVPFRSISAPMTCSALTSINLRMYDASGIPLIVKNAWHYHVGSNVYGKCFQIILSKFSSDSHKRCASTSLPRFQLGCPNRFLISNVLKILWPLV